MLLSLAGAVSASGTDGDAAASVEPTPGLGTALEPAGAAETLAAAGKEPRPFHLYAGLDLVTSYVSRGLVFSDEPSAQPWAELDVPLRRDAEAGPLDSISAFAGIWSSIHDGEQFAESRSGNVTLTDSFYETDLYTGVRVAFLDRFTSSLRANYYFSPSGDWEQIWELDWRLSYNDAAHWQGALDGFTLNPSLRIAKELEDDGGPEGWFFRPQLEPSFTFNREKNPVTVSVPLVLGFGADGQYVDDDGSDIHFGYFQTGLGASGPLDLMPEKLGQWRWSAGVDVIIVSDQSLNFEGDQVTTVGKLGLSFSY